MEKIMELYNWVMSNKDTLVNAIAYAVTTASIIVKLTPSLKDDNWLLPIVKFVGKYIALNTNAPIERPK